MATAAMLMAAGCAVPAPSTVTKPLITPVAGNTPPASNTPPTPSASPTPNTPPTPNTSPTHNAPPTRNTHSDATTQPGITQATSAPADNNLYRVENQWGGQSAPWNYGGMFVIGNRSDQHVVTLDISSNDGGATLTGTMTYRGEGAVGFRGVLRGNNNYAVENQWGGTGSSWQPGGTFVLGDRADKNVVAIDVSSSDGGTTLTGTMSYNGEGSIGFQASRAGG